MLLYISYLTLSNNSLFGKKQKKPPKTKLQCKWTMQKKTVQFSYLKHYIDHDVNAKN